MRFAIAALALCLLTMPAQSQIMDDFDCTSDIGGPETPAGILRISSESEFAWLDAETGLPGPFYPFELKGESVEFGQPFANHIVPGSMFMQAAYFEDNATFEAVLFTPNFEVVLVSCPYIY